MLRTLKKISKMKPNEMFYRFNKIRQNFIEGSKFLIYGDKNPTLFVPKNILNIKYTTISLKNKYFFGFQKDRLDKLKEEYIRFFQTSVQSTLEIANKIMDNKLNLLGQDFYFKKGFEWNKSLITGQEYPQKYFRMIPYRRGKYGDIKYIWELNRHQFFIDLAKAYFVTEDKKYAEKLKQLIKTWIDSNPYKMTVNWTSALESAVRVFAWLWVYFFTEQSEIWDNEFKKIFIRNLLLEGIYIEENLSIYYSPYNHLIGELSALSLLGIMLPEIDVSWNWREKYWEELENQIEKQFYEDGFTVEQASYYNQFTLGFYIMLALLRRQNGLTVSKNIWDRIEKVIEFSMYVTRPDGKTPMIGDIDNARSIYFYPPKKMWDLRYLLALGAVIFKRSDFKYVSGGRPFEEILWLTGIDGLEEYLNIKSQRPKYLSKAFKESGYFILRDGWETDSNYCLFDCGEIGEGLSTTNVPSVSHGHADILNFELSISGKPIIIDPGLNTYFGDSRWTRYFRTTRGHNTIEVNGFGQATLVGRLGWANVSQPKLLTWTSSSEFDFVAGENSGFSGLKENVYNRRYVLFLKGKYFLMIDEIVGDKKDFFIESFLHFSPFLLNIFIDETVVIAKNRKWLWISSNSKFSPVLVKAHPSTEEGWISTGYGNLQKSSLLKIQIKNKLPVVIGMLFPLDNVSHQILDFKIEKISADFYKFIITYQTQKDIIFFNPSRNMHKVSFNNNIFHTDALILFLNTRGKDILNLYAIVLEKFKSDFIDIKQKLDKLIFKYDQNRIVINK